MRGCGGLLERVGRASPVDVWWRFAGDVRVELERGARGDGDIAEVAAVDLGSHCNTNTTTVQRDFFRVFFGKNPHTANAKV